MTTDTESQPTDARPLSEQNIASFTVDLVVALGADTAFCLTGGMAMYLNRAVASHPGLQPVYCQHEQAAVTAAEGYCKATNFTRPGLAVVTAGPGVTNSVTSLCSAFGDSVPVVVLAGQIKTADLDRFGVRTHGAQEVRSQEIITPCVKRFTRLEAATAVEQLIDTLAEAFTGRPGPVFIETPLDVQNRAMPYGPKDISAARDAVLQRRLAAVNTEHAGRIQQALTWLCAGQRPLIYVGAGCRIANCGSALVAFATEAGVPMVTSWLTTDLVPSDHPLNFGPPGGLAPIWSNRVLYGADRILFLGARLDLGTTAFQRDEFGAQAERLMVDVDSAELSKFNGLKRTLTLEANLDQLPMALDRWRVSGGQSVACDAWIQTCNDVKDREVAIERQKLDIGACNVFGLADRLSRWPGDRIYAPTGSGAGIEAFIRFFSPAPGSRCFFGASLGAMGLGLPQAIGAAFAGAGPVICIEGDGGLMLNLQELATLAHYAPPGFVLFILNNDGYLSILNSQLRHFGHASGADRASGVFLPDYRAISAAFGLTYERIDSLAGLDALLARLTPDLPPLVVDLIVDRSESRGPGVKTHIDTEGRITSSSLADIAW
jgi:acetolactate synthase-1/2/3 large subunit